MCVFMWTAGICLIITELLLLGGWFDTLFDKRRKIAALLLLPALFALSLVPCAVNTTLKNYYQGVCRTWLTQLISVLQNFALTALFAFLLSRLIGTTGIWLAFLCGESLTALIICAIVFIKNKKVAFGVDRFSLLPPDFGVRDEKLFECSIRTEEQVIEASRQMTQFCLSHGRDPRLSSLIGLCVEEMGANIVQHGFVKDTKTDHVIDVRLMLKPEQTILRIRDNCVGFDPVKYLEAHQQDGPEGPQGIRLVMKMVKESRYVNSMGLNNLTLIL